MSTFIAYKEALVSCKRRTQYQDTEEEQKVLREAKLTRKHPVTSFNGREGKNFNKSFVSDQKIERSERDVDMMMINEPANKEEDTTSKLILSPITSDPMKFSSDSLGDDIIGLHGESLDDEPSKKKFKKSALSSTPKFSKFSSSSVSVSKLLRHYLTWLKC